MARQEGATLFLFQESFKSVRLYLAMILGVGQWANPQASDMKGLVQGTLVFETETVC